ncbi:hypothetical protein [Bradyrhizobium sp. CCGUVB23]|uniref:hypothetical protein n=1 Tax=Bradyrhizobium sp. CCGUVB23 TaxID=2949630 RepID=UPI0020B4356A|nr:hypothetical protein [Bradyrhizobium sp. CCGUVB23]MCP3462940.1 hypothetical protein [Bradyrhizobium sp. CCGUVB23]
MTLSDAIGYLAAGLVLVTFCQRRMIPLRLAAIWHLLPTGLCSASLRFGSCIQSSCL